MRSFLHKVDDREDDTNHQEQANHAPHEGLRVGPSRGVRTCEHAQAYRDKGTGENCANADLGDFLRK